MDFLGVDSESQRLVRLSPLQHKPDPLEIMAL
jgi:hypothetical protein